MILNITNGDYFNRYFIEKLNSLYEGNAIPFREAMIDGETVKDVFSDEFIRLRAAHLSVDEAFYRENAKDIFEFCTHHTDYTEIRLWFGEDTFCQLNLLTLLALLEKINYKGKLKLYIIDDETREILKKDIPFSLGSYQNLYEKVLIERSKKDFDAHAYGVISKKAIELYFDYLSNDGALAKIVLHNKEKEENALIALLLLQSKEYGLSDLNVKNLIKRVLKK